MLADSASLAFISKPSHCHVSPSTLPTSRLFRAEFLFSIIECVIVNALRNVSHFLDVRQGGVKGFQREPHVLADRRYSCGELGCPSQPCKCHNKKMEIAPTPKNELVVLWLSGIETAVLQIDGP